LRYVEAVAEHGSIQAASRALGIAASAIDRHIRSLEEASQAPLFERLPRGMRPTAADEAVIVLARRWRADAERLDSGLKEMRGQEHGTVRLAAMDSLANSILPDLVHWLQAEHPRIHLAVNVVTPAEASRELDDGTVDLVIAFNLPQQRHQHRLWTKQLPFGCAMQGTRPMSTAVFPGLPVAKVRPYSRV
jgi:DNA-binding transcriptional LysR family regulator